MILELAKVEMIAMRRLERFERVKRSEDITAVAEMKMAESAIEEDEGRHGGTLSEGTWKIREEWATDRAKWKDPCKTRYPAQGGGNEI